MTQKAVFLDRDGVLVLDRGVVTDLAQFSVMDGVPEALWMLKRAGYLLVVVTNQAVVARGLLTEESLQILHGALRELLVARGAPPLDAIYSCPHHPNADHSAYRMSCVCRKPRPGMLLQAAAEHRINLSLSYMVGDRRSDVLAGQRAGCRTVLVESGQHLAPPIQGSEGVETGCVPDFLALNLLAAAQSIILHP